MTSTEETTAVSRSSHNWLFWWVGLPLTLTWVSRGAFEACATYWIPVPFFGFFRYDIAILVGLFLQGPLLYVLTNAFIQHRSRTLTKCPSSGRWKVQLAAVIAIIWMVLPHLPSSIRPLYYVKHPKIFVGTLPNPFPETSDPSSILSVREGLSKKQTKQILALAWRHRDDWTHASASQSLGYLQWGASINIDRAYKRPQGHIYNPELGFLVSKRRLKRESSFRLRFQKYVQYVQDAQIRAKVLPIVAPVYARLLNISDDERDEKLWFGDQVPLPKTKFRKKDNPLGLPSVGIVLPNVLWHWMINPHRDRLYWQALVLRLKLLQQEATELAEERQKMKQQQQNDGFQVTNEALDSESSSPFECSNDPKVHAMIMPLSIPPGAGLRYWTSVENYHDVEYEVGKVYSFDSSVLHAILPLQYNELDRSPRLILQTFAAECDDGRWVLFH